MTLSESKVCQNSIKNLNFRDHSSTFRDEIQPKVGGGGGGAYLLPKILRCLKFSFFNCISNIRCYLYPVEHVLEDLIVLLPALGAIVQHQIEVHDPRPLVLQLRPAVLHAFGPRLKIWICIQTDTDTDTDTNKSG